MTKLNFNLTAHGPAYPRLRSRGRHKSAEAIAGARCNNIDRVFKLIETTLFAVWQFRIVREKVTAGGADFARRPPGILKHKLLDIALGIARISQNPALFFIENNRQISGSTSAKQSSRS